MEGRIIPLTNTINVKDRNMENIVLDEFIIFQNTTQVQEKYFKKNCTFKLKLEH